MKLTEAQIADSLRALDRVRESISKGRPEPSRAPPDPYDVRNMRLDASKGAVEKREPWDQVMERHGFKWFEPHELAKRFGLEVYVPAHLEGLIGPYGEPLVNANIYQQRMPLHGQYRRPGHAFTVLDLVSLFQTPENFDLWWRENEQREAAARAGVQLPSKAVKKRIKGEIVLPRRGGR